MPTQYPREPTANQRMFIAEYLIDMNASAAYRRAGYSAKNSDVASNELMKLPHIKAAIDAALAAREKRVGATADEVLRELRRIGHADPVEIVSDTGALRALREIPEDTRRAIASYEVDADGIVKIKFWDKTRALEMEAKHLKLLTDKLEISADASFAEVLKAARARAGR